MPKSGYTHVEVLLDRSGSMEEIKEDMEGGFNSFLDDQRRESGYATIGLTQFDTVHETVYAMLPVKSAPRLNLDPRGGTALIDALCRSIDDLGTRLRTMSDNERPEKVIFVIITDGHENSSRKHRRSDVHDRITRQRDKYQWDFVFLGANQDAIAEARSYGIPMASTMDFATSRSGIGSTYSVLSSNVTNSRNTGASTNFTKADREAAVEK